MHTSIPNLKQCEFCILLCLYRLDVIFPLLYEKLFHLFHTFSDFCCIVNQIYKCSTNFQAIARIIRLSNSHSLSCFIVLLCVCIIIINFPLTGNGCLVKHKNANDRPVMIICLLTYGSIYFKRTWCIWPPFLSPVPLCAFLMFCLFLFFSTFIGQTRYNLNFQLVVWFITIYSNLKILNFKCWQVYMTYFQFCCCFSYHYFLWIAYIARWGIYSNNGCIYWILITIFVDTI